MAKIAVCNMDTAGGLILPRGNTSGYYRGEPIAVLGDPVMGHGEGPHAGPVLVQGSTKAYIKGIPIVLEGMVASCGHPATGRPDATCSA